MSDWRLSYNEDGTIVTGEVDYRNVTGLLISSVTRITAQTSGAQTPPAGIFVVEADTTSSVTVSAYQAADLKSPALQSSGVTVYTDGSTPNLNIIPGLSIVLGANFAVGSQAEIGIGCVYDVTISLWKRLSSLGLGVGGIEGADRYVLVTNMSGDDQSNCVVIATNSARIENSYSTSRPIYAFQQTGILSPTADSDLNGQEITFDNFVAGSPNTVDILVDGSPVDVYDVTNDTLITDGLQLNADDTTVYRFADGTDQQSIEFILSSSLIENDTATLYVSDGGDFVELYDDVAGEYVAGTGGVSLTSDDCGTGIVLEDDDVQFQMRLNPSVSKDITLNQRQISFRFYSEGV